MTTTKTLVGITKEIGLQYTRAKKVVWDRIIRFGHQRLLAADDGLSFTFQRVKAAEGSVPTWVILTPEREHGDRDRAWILWSNKSDQYPRSNTKKIFCTGNGDKISRSKFGPKNPPPESVPCGPAPPPNEKGNPSAAAVEAPIDFFNLQISLAYISNVRKGTNYRASAEDVGIGVTGREAKEFGDSVAFDDVEIYKFIGFLFANGLTPRSNFDSWFTNLPNCPLYDANFTCGAFDKVVHGRRVPGLRRCRHFRRFFTLSNYRLNASLLSGCQTYGRSFTWIICLNHRNFFPRCISQTV
jgi:hypothetical protein